MVDFRIQVIIDPRGVQQGARQVERSLDRIDRKTTQVTQKASRLGGAFRSAFAPLLGIAGAALAIRTLSNFEQEIAAVGAISQASAKELEAFRDVAIDLGTNTRFSATQAAEGLTFLARAGFTASESLEAIDGTLKLAQAGQLNLGRAADIASNVLKGFRLEVSQTARVVDVLALSANSSNTTVNQLGEALSFAAPIASGLGVSIEETTAAVSALSNAGLQGSRAGTGLNRVLANLEAPTEKAKEILASLGVQTDEVRVTTVGLTGAIARLAEAGVSTGQALEIFGQRGGPAFEVLSSSVPDVIKFTNQFGQAAGTADELAEALDDNLQGSLLALRSAFQGLILELGEAGATGALRGTVDAFTEGFRFLAENAGVVQAAFIGLSSVIVAQYVPGLVAGTSATVAQTLALVGFNTATSVSLVAVRRFSLALKAVPFAAVAIALVEINSELKDYISLQEEALEVTEQGVGFALTDFAIANQKLINARRQLAVTEAEVRREQEAGREVGGALASIYERQKQKVAELQRAVDLFRETQSSTNEELEAAAAAFDLQAKSVEELIATLDAENEVMLKRSREREIQLQLIQEIAALEAESGQKVTEEQRKQIELALRRNRSFQEQAALLDEIRGKQSEFGPLAAALNELRRKGLITEQQYNETFAELRENLLGITTAEKDREVVLERVNERQRAGFLVTQQIGVALGVAAELAERYTKTIALGVRAAKGPTEFYRQTQIGLNLALEEGRINAEEYTIATNNLTVASAQAGTNLGQGIDVGLARVQNQILDTSGLVEDALVGAFNKAEDALVDFLTTGEADFSAFVDSVLQDLTRLLVRQALKGVLGFAGIEGFADGGQVPGNRPILVGEEGPELFIPPSAGRIASNPETRDLLSQGGGGGAASVNIVNVLDPELVTAALSSSGGEQIILNVIRNNASTVRQSIS